uniref:Uncharacterized protein n=1 Tax=Triticum urartu TaxID=4572 RepID=A0A8R7QEC7_TRIUA
RVHDVRGRHGLPVGGGGLQRRLPLLRPRQGRRQIGRAYESEGGAAGRGGAKSGDGQQVQAGFDCGRLRTLVGGVRAVLEPSVGHVAEIDQDAAAGSVGHVAEKTNKQY